MEIVVEKDRVVRARAQQPQRFRHIGCDVYEVSLEAIGKPAMASFVVVKQKHADRMALSSDAGQAELSE
jgi:DNA mismatch repair protein MutH